MKNEHINCNITRTNVAAHQIDGVRVLPCSYAPIPSDVHPVLTRQSTPPFTYVNLFSHYSIGSHSHFVYFTLVSPLPDAVDPDTSFFIALVLTERLLSLGAKKYDTRTNTPCQ